MQTSIRTPRISVIIPAYGRPRFLRELLESVCLESESNLVEVIVIDDGSTEPIAPALAAEFASVPVRFERQDHAGTAAARNFGASLARGEFLLFIDDDDLLVPGSLTWRVQLLDSETSCSAVAGRCEFVRDGLVMDVEPVRWRGDVCRWDVLIHNRFYSPGQILIRRSAFEHAGGFPLDRTGSDDWALWIELTRYGPIIADERIALGYRVHDGNYSRNVATMYRGAVAVSDDATASLCSQHAPLARYLSVNFIAGVYAAKLAEATTDAFAALKFGSLFDHLRACVELHYRKLSARLRLKVIIVRDHGRFRMSVHELSSSAKFCLSCSGAARAAEVGVDPRPHAIKELA